MQLLKDIGSLLMAIISDFWKKFTGGNKTASSSSSPAVGLPTSSVAAVAGAIIETERLVEKQVELHNTPEMQRAKLAQQEIDLKNKLENDASKGDLNEMRKDTSS